MSQTFNMFDLIFLFSSLIILILAFFRGFVREIFSLINWFISIAIVYFLSPFLSVFLQNYISDKIVANIASSILIFIIIFIVSSLIVRKFANIFREKMPLNTDQILGVVYGFIKIFLIFGFIYSVTLNIHSSIYNISDNAKSSKKMPSWLYNSKFKSVIAPFGNVIDPIIHQILNKSQKRYIGEKNLIKKQDNKPNKKRTKEELNWQESEGNPFEIFEKGKEIKNFIDDYQDNNKNNEIIENKAEKKLKKDDEKYDETGYSRKQIEKMDRLIEIIE